MRGKLKDFKGIVKVVDVKLDDTHMFITKTEKDFMKLIEKDAAVFNKENWFYVLLDGTVICYEEKNKV